MQETEQVPTEHVCPSGHATVVPHSKHPSASVLPHSWTPLALQVVVPSVSHSFTHSALHVPPEHDLPVPHDCGVLHSRQASVSD